jgi:multidrug efflux pump subunit AcrB
MASSVATPLEQQFSAIPGLDQMTSTSGLGSVNITLQFALDRSIDGAAQDVQTAINAAGGLLPKDLPNPPTYKKTNPADRPILIYAVSSDAMPICRLDDYAYTIIAQKISTISGVAQVDIAGQQQYAAHIQINPGALAARGIGLEDVRTALTAATLDEPKGNLEGPHQTYAIDTNDQLFTANAYKNVIIAYRNGAPIRVKDVGDVIDSSQLSRTGAFSKGKSAEILLVRRQSGANTVDVVNQIKALMPSLEASIPPSVHVELISDRSQTVSASIDDRAGRRRHLSVFAQCLGNDHSERHGPVIARRHIRRDVCAWLQSRQLVVDGADHRGGFRGGRRHRDDRKYRPLYRGGRKAFRRRDQGRRSDRFHHYFDHLLADRRFHSVAVHVGHRRTTVP